MIVWGPNNAIDVGKWLIYGGGRLERFYCIYIYRKFNSGMSVLVYIPIMDYRANLGLQMHTHIYRNMCICEPK